MRFLLVILYIVFASPIFANTSEPIHINKTDWEEAKEDINYSDEEEIEQIEKPTTAPTKDWKPNFEGFKYVAYVLLGLGLAVIFVLVFKKIKPVSNISGSKIEAQTLEEAEDNLPELALNNILKEALDKQEFKRALRIKFLMVLQKLIDANMIQWRKRKTNEQYLIEIKNSTIKPSFGVIVQQFDAIWYGEKTINELQFNGLAANIDELNSRIVSE